MIEVSWSTIKDFCQSRNLSIQFVDANGNYYLKAQDGYFALECILNKSLQLEEVADFEAGLKLTGNQSPNTSVVVKNTPDVTPLATKNEYTMEPWGAKKFKFTCSDYCAAITLSNKSVDGHTFNYDLGSYPLIPRIGDYIFQDDFCERAWITAIDPVTQTLTLDSETDRPTLNNGAAVYSRGVWVGVKVPMWHDPMYLWGLTVKTFFSGTDHNGKNDFVELSVVDVDDKFLNDAYCLAHFGVDAASAMPYIEASNFEQNGEYGHWTKYYDESWIVSIDGKVMMTPDGAPGMILSQLETRISYFPTRADSTVVEVFLDYLPTSKT
jgi:hypothetical protein